MKQLFLCSALLWAFANVFAQNQITGTVSNKQTGEAIPFVNIYNKSNKLGTSTNFLGQFSIEGSPVDSLQISYVGFDKITILAREAEIITLVASSFSLEEIVVSANRENERRTEAPIAISTISNKTIEENKPTTIDQVLNQTPGVYMVDLGNEQHTMSIRRPIDYGASYLYLEDGVPIRASGVFNHNALLEINMANTSKIEIIRGPASSLYGSEAIGGAVNFISKKPSIKPSAGLRIQGNDIGYKRTDFYASSTFKNKLGIRVSGYYADQKDGVVKHSDFDKLALSLSADYTFSEKTNLTWSNTLVDYYSDMTGSLDSSDFYSKNYASNQTFTNRKVNAYRTKLAMNHYWNQKSKTTVTGYYRKNSIKQTPSYRVKDDFKPWIPSGNPNLAHGEMNDNSFESYGIIAQHKQGFEWLNSSLIVGGSVDYSPNDYNANYIEIYKNEDGFYESYQETDSVLADYQAKLLNTAAYVQYKVQPLKGLNIIGAIRFDQFNYQFDNALGANAYTSVLDGQNTFSQFTPKLGATYEIKKNTGVYGNYSQGFVPPQVGELYRGNEVPVLKPVYYDNYELGGWLTFLKNKAKLDVSVYQMIGENEIISVLQDDGSTIRKNAGKTQHQGIEYGLNMLIHKDVSFRIGGTNSIHEFVEFDEAGTDLSGNDMPQAPNWIMNSQITYRPNYFKGFRLSVEWQHIDKYYMDQQNTKEYKGYDIINARLGYTWKSFDVWLNVINASDELYATVARSSRWGDSYSLGKPRNFNIGLAYNFIKRK